MSDLSVDKAFVDYFEDAKSFYELAKDFDSKDDLRGTETFTRASLLLGFASFEAFLTSVTSDFIAAKNSMLTTHDKALLMELKVTLDSDGVFQISNRHKFMKLEERVLFLHYLLAGKKLDRSKPFWSRLLTGIKLRNEVVHPKTHKVVDIKTLENTLEAILDTMNLITKGAYKKPLPLASARLIPLNEFSLISVR
jgi:hypothetical protein